MTLSQLLEPHDSSLAASGLVELLLLVLDFFETMILLRGLLKVGKLVELSRRLLETWSSSQVAHNI